MCWLSTRRHWGQGWARLGPTPEVVHSSVAWHGFGMFELAMEKQNSAAWLNCVAPNEQISEAYLWVWEKCGKIHSFFRRRLMVNWTPASSGSLVWTMKVCVCMCPGKYKKLLSRSFTNQWPLYTVLGLWCYVSVGFSEHVICLGKTIWILDCGM